MRFMLLSFHSPSSTPLADGAGRDSCISTESGGTDGDGPSDLCSDVVLPMLADTVLCIGSDCIWCVAEE